MRFYGPLPKEGILLFAVLLRWRVGTRGTGQAMDWSPRGARIIIDYFSMRGAWRVCLFEVTALTTVMFEVADTKMLNISVFSAATPESGLRLARAMIERQTRLAYLVGDSRSAVEPCFSNPAGAPSARPSRNDRHTFAPG